MIYLYLVKLLRIMRDTLLICCRDFVTTDYSLNEKITNITKLKLSTLITELAMAK